MEKRAVQRAKIAELEAQWAREVAARLPPPLSDQQPAMTPELKKLDAAFIRLLAKGY